MGVHLADPLHRLTRLVDAEGGLGEPGDRLVGVHAQGVDVLRGLDQGDVVGCLTRGALHLLVAGMADEQNPRTILGEPSCLVMHLGDQRAGGVDGAQAAPFGLLLHLRGDAVCREDHQ